MNECRHNVLAMVANKSLTSQSLLDTLIRQLGIIGTQSDPPSVKVLISSTTTDQQSIVMVK
jgi:hypothetical protein